jgi:outer membrane beta-barrel protein
MTMSMQIQPLQQHEKIRSFLLASSLAVLTLIPVLGGVARAELPERKSPLADAPAVRHRHELRSLRFEIGPGVTTTIGQDFYHAVMVGGKASFFLSDWLALSGMFGQNLTKDMKTSFHTRLEGALQGQRMANDRAPSLAEAQRGMNKIGQVFAVEAELIPFSGKYSFAGKLFANYDFYAFGGPGFINFTSDEPACTAPGPSCPVTGMKIGANFGIGMRTYFNDFVTMNLEARDIIIRNNPSGRDETGDRIADGEDLSWDSNYMVGLSFTFFLPPTARISD